MAYQIQPALCQHYTREYFSHAWYSCTFWIGLDWILLESMDPFSEALRCLKNTRTDGANCYWPDRCNAEQDFLQHFLAQVVF